MLAAGSTDRTVLRLLWPRAAGVNAAIDWRSVSLQLASE